MFRSYKPVDEPIGPMAFGLPHHLQFLLPNEIQFCRDGALARWRDEIRDYGKLGKVKNAIRAEPILTSGWSALRSG